MTTFRSSFFALAALIMTAGTASADDAHRNANRQVSFSFGTHYLDYTEYDDYERVPDGVLDTELGAQPTWQLGFSYQGDAGGIANLYARVDVAAARGSTKYRGYLFDPATGEIVAPHGGRTRNRFWDFEARLGKSFLNSYDPRWQFTPYVSLSRREWIRNVGYVEYYDHHTIGGGALLQWSNGRVVLGIDAGFGKMIDAGMDVPEYDAQFSFGTKTVSSGTVILDFPVGRRGHLVTRFGIDSFKYGESGGHVGWIDDAPAALMEPRSSSKVTTFTIGYARHY